MRRLAGGCPIKWFLFLVVLSKQQSTVKIIKTFLIIFPIIISPNMLNLICLIKVLFNCFSCTFLLNINKFEMLKNFLRNLEKFF